MSRAIGQKKYKVGNMDNDDRLSEQVQIRLSALQLATIDDLAERARALGWEWSRSSLLRLLVREGIERVELRLQLAEVAR